MAFYTGRTGSLMVNTFTIAKIRDWSIETTLELLSTNDISSGSNTFVPGVMGSTGSATLMYYKVLNPNQEFTQVLDKIMKTGSDNVEAGDAAPVNGGDRVQLQLNVGKNEKDSLKCDAYITSASISVSTGELTVVAINFTVDGNLTKAIDAGIPS
jgi:hypothetical protein